MIFCNAAREWRGRGVENREMIFQNIRIGLIGLMDPVFATVGNFLLKIRQPA